MSRWLLLIGMVLALTACGSNSYSNVSVQDLAAAVQEGAYVLDVREDIEFAEGHVQGSTLIPLAQLSSRVSELPTNQPIYVFCRSGNRSRQASEILIKAGLKDVKNVEGGIIAWQGAGYPVAR